MVVRVLRVGRLDGIGNEVLSPRRRHGGRSKCEVSEVRSQQSISYVVKRFPWSMARQALEAYSQLHLHSRCLSG